MVPSPRRNWIAVNAVQQSSLNKSLKTENMTTPHLRKSIGRSPLRLRLFLIPLALAWFAISPPARAVTPAHDGGYPGGNTAEGTNALFSLNNDVDKLALGFTAMILATATINTMWYFIAHIR